MIGDSVRYNMVRMTYYVSQDLSIRVLLSSECEEVTKLELRLGLCSDSIPSQTRSFVHMSAKSCLSKIISQSSRFGKLSEVLV